MADAPPEDPSAEDFSLLFEADLKPIGERGVLVRLPYVNWDAWDAAVFSPWPARLVEGVPFSVWIELADGASAWREPQEVHLIRQNGARHAGSAAVVLLQGPPVAATEIPGGLPLRDRGAADARSWLTTNIPALQPLAAENRAEAARAASAMRTRALNVGHGLPAPAVPDFVRTTGGANAVFFSLCRLFHWD